MSRCICACLSERMLLAFAISSKFSCADPMLIWFEHILLANQLNNKFEQRHEISNNVVCATSKASDQTAHMRSLIRAFTGHLNIL